MIQNNKIVKFSPQLASCTLHFISLSNIPRSAGRISKNNNALSGNLSVDAQLNDGMNSYFEVDWQSSNI
jgi:hypothetical protein